MVVVFMNFWKPFSDDITVSISMPNIEKKQTQNIGKYRTFIVSIWKTGIYPLKS